MNMKNNKLSRRKFLRLGIGSAGVLTLSAAGVLAKSDRVRQQLSSLVTGPAATAPTAPPATAITSGQFMRLGATDGHIELPGRADPLYVFGFINMDAHASVNDVIGAHKGKVQQPSPIIDVMEGDEIFITLTTLGFQARPDLDDAHTIHWHGFRNPNTYFDGVPELSISVPVGRDFPYYYKPLHPGTYMYHCHFEDVEHVQMGMDGIVFVRPKQNTIPVGSWPAGTKYVYNDGDATTRYTREYTMLLNEIDPRPHDELEAVQEFVWSEYKPQFWVINGRSFPDTIKLGNEMGPSQPVSSLVQASGDPLNKDKVLLRIASLGYEQHTMQLPGIPMKVVGHDAALLRNGAIDLTYYTNNIYIGPGEARDVIFEPPDFDPGAVAGTDSVGPYNRYYFRNRNYQKLHNNGTVDAATGLGGMVTEVRVYAGGLPPQSEPNETF